MNNQQRAAMHMALEALERWKEWDERTNQEVHDDIDDKAITALREALAQPQEQDLAYREAKSLAERLFKKHYASQEDYASGRIVWGVCETTVGIITQIDNMVCKLELPLAQPQGEPVAIVHNTDTPGNWSIIKPGLPAGTPLYTTPPVVPQGKPDCLSSGDSEPVAWMYQFRNEAPVFCTEKRDWADNHSEWKEMPLYATPPSSQRADALVEAAIEATKEKAAKVCENVICYHKGVAKLCAAAIRSMK